MQTLTVADVMQSEVRSVHPSMSLVELEEVLIRERISGAPVVERQRLVGVVSRSDVMRQLSLEQAQAEAMSAFYLEPFDREREGAGPSEQVSRTVGARMARMTVADAMIRSLVTVRPDAPISEAARLMVDRRIHRLLVVDDHRLAGIVSSLDLVRVLADAKIAP